MTWYGWLGVFLVLFVIVATTQPPKEQVFEEQAGVTTLSVEVPPPEPCPGSGKYDLIFKRAANSSLIGKHRGSWRKLKAICIVESNLREDAVSSVGAIGVCQLTEAAWQDYGQQPKWATDDPRFDARLNIEATARQFQTYADLWYAPRTDQCRDSLIVASLNAGPGHIIEAQVLSGGKACWNQISEYVDEVTGGNNAAETRGHVAKYHETYIALLECEA